MLKITFQLTEPDAARFDRFASTCGGRSALVRWLVGELLAGRLHPPPSDTDIVVPPVRHNLVELPLTEPEAHALDAACAARGMSRSKWIHALIRCRLGARNAFSKDDRVILRHTAKALRGLETEIGRLRLECKLDTSCGSDTRLKAVEASLTSLTAVIRMAVDGSELYWRDPAQELGSPGLDTGEHPLAP